MNQPIFAALGTVIVYLSLRNILLMGTAWILVKNPSWSQRRLIYRITHEKDQLRKEISAGVVVMFSDAIFLVLLLRLPGVHFNPVSINGFIFTYVSLFVFYEAWFYFTHRLLHHPKLYFIHRQHHIARVVSPFSAMSFSIIERLFQQSGVFLIPAIFAAYFNWICLEAVLLYSLINFIFNILGHSNVEVFNKNYMDSKISRISAGASFHSMHHARFNGHFGLFTTVLDRSLGTYFKDYPEVQKRAAGEKGLTKLTQHF